MGKVIGRVATTVAASCMLCAAAAGQDVLHTFLGGSTAGTGLGQAVRPAGDVNGDGVADLIAGFRIGSSLAGSGAGTARVWSGATGELLYTFVGAVAQDQLGRSVDGAGDVNGDGRADLIVGSVGCDAAGLDAGRARVYSGANGSVLYTIDGPFARARFGHAVAGLGDVNADGRADFAVSGQPDAATPQPAGFVRVYSGANGALIREIIGPVATSRLGFAVADAGDVNGDGVHDMVAGDWRDHSVANSSGAVRVYSGVTGAQLFAFLGGASQDQLGRSVDGAGDVNGDGRADVIAGTPFVNGVQADVGLARVWSGADGSVLFSVLGDNLNDFFGTAVSGIGDVDGDGRDDFAVGASGDDDGGASSGSARVYSGADGSVIFKMIGDTAADELGFSLARVGDVNGDKGLDFAVSAPGDNAGGGALSGTLRIYAGIPPPVVGPQNYCSTSPNSAGPGAVMGWSGSTSVLADDLVLHVTGAPPHTVGAFFFGAAQQQKPFFGGNLCVTPPLYRIGPMVLTRRDGSAAQHVERSRRMRYTALLEEGTTWNFQFIYMDKGKRCRLMYNLSDGLNVTFTP